MRLVSSGALQRLDDELPLNLLEHQADSRRIAGARGSRPRWRRRLPLDALQAERDRNREDELLGLAIQQHWRIAP